MPLGFTKSLASRLNQISKIIVKEAENGEVIKKGVVYVAPSGFQTRIKRKFAQPIFNIEEDNSKDLLFRPCIDVTFTSASDSYKEKVLGIIMTGMGNDGTKGSEYIKTNHGMIFTQSEDSCVIASMPKSVIKAGFSDKTYHLDQMADIINNLFP
jgi:two-component system chemotaxis response regulator CheB